MKDPESDLLVVTDLDGCLLDEETYSYEAATPALAALTARRVPLILASSKTRAEMEPLWSALGLGSPFIVENGGALLIPDHHLTRSPPGAVLVAGLWTIVLGTRRADLLRALEAVGSEAGVRVRSFAGLQVSEIESLTGLSSAAAERAREREYDEPFLLDDEQRQPALARAARAHGLRVTRGGRFWHLTGETDKGRALLVLLGLYEAEGRRFSTVGLGDSPNDLPVLEAVDRPIVVLRPNGEPDPSLMAALPDAERAPVAGPRGWNAAVLAVLQGNRLPRWSA